MIRCVAYYGKVEIELTPDEMARIASRARARHAARGITGCLFHFGGHFVQVIEGPSDEIDRLYGATVADTSRGHVVGLVDNLVEARRFSRWSLKIVGGDAVAAPPVRTPLPSAALDTPALPALHEAWLQRDAGTLDPGIVSHLRVAPQQQRARQTVERLLDAAHALIAESGSVERLSLEAAASRARVTQQSAYRYFANVGDLVRATVRRMQSNWNLRFLDHMVRETFDSEAAVAQAAVDFIAQTYESQIHASGRMKRQILSGYHDIDYEAAWTISDAIAGGISARGSPTPRIDPAAMAAGLTAVWAIAKATLLREPAGLRRPDVRGMMTDLFLAALGAPLAAERRALFLF